MSDIEETLDRIKNHKGVEAVMIVNSDGIPIRSSKKFDDEITQKYALSISSLAARARSMIRDLDPLNDMTFFRMRTKKHEVLVAPDNEFLLIVIQDPLASSTTVVKK